MKPVSFPAANIIYAAPPGWDAAKNGPCVNLHVLDDGETCTSCWAPTWRELLALLFGRRVYLHVAGGQPPVALTVQP